MPGFNFFKVYSQQYSNLVNALESKGLRRVDKKDLKDNEVEFTCELYFTTKPSKRGVKWVKELKKQFSSLGDYGTESYQAVVLVQFQEYIYAISFGAAHFIISRFADLGFGIEIASRLLTRYRTKNSREFGGMKTKSIETYSATSDIAFSAGEAVNFIKGEPFDVNKWGKNVCCGQSVQLRKREFSMRDAHLLCLQLEKALSLPVVRQIPTYTAVKDPQKCRQLSEKLISDMEQGHYMVSISQQQLSGVAFLFIDRYEFICRTMNHQNFRVEEDLSLEDLRVKTQQYFGGDYRALLKADVEAQEDGERAYTKPFIQFIDYVDTEGDYYLEEGKWYQFDKNYLHNVRCEVDRIPLELKPEIVKFDESEYQRWLTKQTKGEKHYREQYLNNLLEKNHGYSNLDRIIGNFEGASIEIADLFKDGVVCAVKIGTPQVLNYVIDQATASMRVLERRNFRVEVGGVTKTVSKVALWLFLDRKNPITHISEINSLIFLMKLARWRKDVLMCGLLPEIRVSYK